MLKNKSRIFWSVVIVIVVYYALAAMLEHVGQQNVKERIKEFERRGVLEQQPQ